MHTCHTFGLRHSTHYYFGIHLASLRHRTTPYPSAARVRYLGGKDGRGAAGRRPGAERRGAQRCAQTTLTYAGRRSVPKTRRALPLSRVAPMPARLRNIPRSSSTTASPRDQCAFETQLCSFLSCRECIGAAQRGRQSCTRDKCGMRVRRSRTRGATRAGHRARSRPRARRANCTPRRARSR